MRPGEILAQRFRLQGLAGAGGMGAVWRAVDTTTGELVAVKVMLQQASDPARFAHEGRVLARLQHQAIVRYVAHGTTDDGRLFLAMEWLEGTDLAARLARGPLRIAEALALGTRLAEALAEAHACGVVHRDVKPANVFLPRGDIGEAKLIDFGIARAAHLSGPTTAPGLAVGTIGYMAPEQARGAADVGPGADVFALGCVLFECLTAKPLFTGEHWVAVLAKVLVQDAARLSDVMSGAPAALDELLARMLEKEPARRPADARAVSRALAGIATRSLESLVPAPPRTLSGDEMRVASVVLVGRAAGADLTHTVEATVAEAETARLKALGARFGARLERLADGSLLAVVEGGLPSDQAAQAARCALVLRREMPHRPVALATGRAPLGRRVPLGEPIDAAAARLRAPIALGVRIDEATASLLGDVFRIEGDVLVGEGESMAEGVRIAASKAPFVGRERSLAELEGLFAECRADSVARAAIVVAPPGAGKSRLLAELVQRLRDDGSFRLWRGRGDPVGTASTFGLLGGAIRHGLGLRPTQPPDTQTARLIEHAGEGAAPFLAELLGIASEPSAGPVREQLIAARRDPKLMYERVRRAFDDLVVAEASRGPCLVVLEDMQWADEPSVRLLGSALRAAARLPLFVLGLGRPEAAQRFPALWPDGDAQRLPLAPLAPRAAAELVRALLPGASHPDVARIVDEGAGNPLLLEELARAEWEQSAPMSGPRTLAAMLHARLERVPPELRLVLRAASVFGVTFWRGGVRALLDLDEADASARVARLVDAELVAPSDTSRFADDDELVFRTQLLREATYASLTDADRKLGHRLAGAWLESMGESDALLLAEHAERGGEPARASRLYLAAARRARAASDLGAVEALASRGLSLGAPRAERGALLLLRGEAKQWQGALDEASGLLDAALRDLGPGEEDWFSALALLGLAEFRRGHRDDAEAVALRILDGGAAAEGVAASRVLEFAAALVLFGRLDLGARLGAVARVADDAAAQGELQAFLASCAYMRRDLDDAAARVERAAELLERAGDLRAASIELFNAGYFRLELGDDDGAEAFILRAGELRRRLGIVHVAHNLARLEARRGRVDEAIALERETIEASRRSGDARIEGYARAHLAALLLGRGGLEDAEAEAREACSLLTGTPPLRPLALATLADVLRARGALDRALAAAEEAMAAARADVTSGNTVVALALAEAQHAAGQTHQARATLDVSEAELRARAARIRDAALRDSFLRRVPENARTIELARAWREAEG